LFDPEYVKKHPKPSGLLGFILKRFIKKLVVSEKPFKRSVTTRRCVCSGTLDW